MAAIIPTGSYRVQRDIVNGSVWFTLMGPNGFSCGVNYHSREAAQEAADGLNAEGCWTPQQIGLEDAA